ncbi:MAG TPA: hypothetical protein VHQ47_00520 [Phycisphaerae bacterium]|nr:hypothetical protein [Phycisphaerae bacterium]
MLDDHGERAGVKGGSGGQRWEKKTGAAGEPYVVRPGRTAAQVEAEFKHHFAKWVEETGWVSNYGVLMSHPSYLAIVGLGLPAVPYLLEEIRRGGGGALLAALEAITGENPVLPEHEGSSEQMVADWLAWGRAHGIV